MDVSIIILNYKTPTMCCECIKSLKEKSSGFSYEIIVIDNASGDNSKEIIESTFKDEVRFIANQDNLGTARAFNQGAKLAKGDYLFYLNTDTLFCNNAIKAQLDFIRSRDDVAIVGGNLFSSDMVPTHSYIKHFFKFKHMRFDASFFGIIWNKLFKKSLSKSFNYSNKPKKVDYVCAAATLMRKDVYLKLGGFDERIFIYGDEALYAFNCLSNGYYSYNDPESKIIHFEGDSFNKDSSDFSEARVKRFCNGLAISMNEIHGQNGALKYFKYRRRLLKNQALLFLLTGKKQKAINAKKEANIIYEYSRSIKTN